jgi:predicted alpha/beta superfamily hydrolase
MQMRLVVSVVYTAVVVLSAGLSPNSAFAQDATDAKPATIWYSEQFIFHSKSLERDFLIQVAKPLKPQTSKVSVIYVLDGNSLFPAVASMMQGYGGFGHSAPAYVVGIGYPDQTLEQWFSLRTHDLLSGPVPDSVKEVPDSFKAAAASGNGAGFAKFLLQELRPMIERRYPVDPHQSILAGHSLGASFASHVLLHDSGAFDDYLLCSPSIWTEPQLLDKASTFHAASPLKVFIGAGTKEDEDFVEGHMLPNAHELVARLRNHASAVDVSLVEFEGKNHGTSLPDCISQGIRTLLPSPPAASSH